MSCEISVWSWLHLISKVVPARPFGHPSWHTKLSMPGGSRWSFQFYDHHYTVSKRFEAACTTRLNHVEPGQYPKLEKVIASPSHGFVKCSRALPKFWMLFWAVPVRSSFIWIWRMPSIPQSCEGHTLRGRMGLSIWVVHLIRFLTDWWW